MRFRQERKEKRFLGFIPDITIFKEPCCPTNRVATEKNRSKLRLEKEY